MVADRCGVTASPVQKEAIDQTHHLDADDEGNREQRETDRKRQSLSKQRRSDRQHPVLPDPPEGQLDDWHHRITNVGERAIGQYRHQRPRTKPPETAALPTHPPPPP